MFSDVLDLLEPTASEKALQLVLVNPLNERHLRLPELDAPVAHSLLARRGLNRNHERLVKSLTCSLLQNQWLNTC